MGARGELRSARGLCDVFALTGKSQPHGGVETMRLTRALGQRCHGELGLLINLLFTGRFLVAVAFLFGDARREIIRQLVWNLGRLRRACAHPFLNCGDISDREQPAVRTPGVIPLHSATKPFCMFADPQHISD